MPPAKGPRAPRMGDYAALSARAVQPRHDPGRNGRQQWGPSRAEPGSASGPQRPGLASRACWAQRAVAGDACSAATRPGRTGLAIGVDIGGTKVAAGVVDSGGADPEPGEAVHARQRSPGRGASHRGTGRGAGRRPPDPVGGDRRRRLDGPRRRHGAVQSAPGLAQRAVAGKPAAAAAPAGAADQRRRRGGLGRMALRRRPGTRTGSSASPWAPASAGPW